MTKTFRSSRLTTCDTVENGETIRLDFLDEMGRPASVELPFAQAQSIAMTLPGLLSKALQGRTNSAAARFVFPLGQWCIERGDDGCLIVTLATDDGFQVSFGVPFDACQAIGWSLQRESSEAADGANEPSVLN